MQKIQQFGQTRVTRVVSKHPPGDPGSGPAMTYKTHPGPLALGRKNYLFCGNHDAAVRAAIVYSLFASCKAAGVDTREWLEDILKRLPSEKDTTALLPGKWQKNDRS